MLMQQKCNCEMLVLLDAAKREMQTGRVSRGRNTSRL